MNNAPIFRNDQPDTIFIDQPPDNMGMRPADYRNDHPLLTPLFVRIDDANLHPVIVHNLLHLVFGQENIFPAIISDHKTVSIRMCMHITRNEMRGGIDFVVASGITHQLTVTFHGIQTFQQTFHASFTDMQLPCNGFGTPSPPCLTQGFNNFFPTGNGIRIFFQKIS